MKIKNDNFFIILFQVFDNGSRRGSFTSLGKLSMISDLARINDACLSCGEHNPLALATRSYRTLAKTGPGRF